MFKTFYRGGIGGPTESDLANGGFGGGIHEETWSDEEDEDEAEYGGETGLHRHGTEF